MVLIQMQILPLAQWVLSQDNVWQRKELLFYCLCLLYVADTI